MQAHPTRTILILLVFAIVGLSVLGVIAHRYSRMLVRETPAVESVDGQLDRFIRVRSQMVTALAALGEPAPDARALIRVRAAALAQHDMDLAAYARLREKLRAWRAGRLAAGSAAAAAFEARRERLRAVDLGGYERLDS